MIGLIVLREPIVALLFQRGEFGADSTRLTAYALIFYSAGLWAFSAVRVVVSTFYSLQDTVTPVKMASISIIANILLSLLLMGPLSHGGLALATSLASMLNFCLLVWVLRRRLGELNGKTIIESVAKSVICALVMGGALGYLLYLFPLPGRIPISTARGDSPGRHPGHKHLRDLRICPAMPGTKRYHPNDKKGAPGMTFKPWQLKIGLAAAILILAAYLGAILFGDNGLIALNRKKARLEKIQAENRVIEKENRALYRRVNRLKNDPAYLEYIIRQELSLVGEDEIVFKFKKE